MSILGLVIQTSGFPYLLGDYGEDYQMLRPRGDYGEDYQIIRPPGNRAGGQVNPMFTPRYCGLDPTGCYRMLISLKKRLCGLDPTGCYNPS